MMTIHPVVQRARETLARLQGCEERFAAEWVEREARRRERAANPLPRMFSRAKALQKGFTPVYSKADEQKLETIAARAMVKRNAEAARQQAQQQRPGEI